MKHYYKLAIFLAIILIMAGVFRASTLDNAKKSALAIDQYNLGLKYQFGRGVAENASEAFKWYKKSAELGNVSAEAKACALYYSGIGVSKDTYEAIKWCQKAAEAGNTFGQVIVGMAYFDGLYGVGKDVEKAIKWYRKAAEQGVAYAQAKLGSAYADGIGGLPKDYVLADMWISLAAEQNDSKAPKALMFQSVVERAMTQEQVIQAKQLQNDWKKQHPYLVK
jgi:hypothetical protein